MEYLRMMILEEIFKDNKSQNSEGFNLRIQRGLSWFKKAIFIADDLELQFMSLMIAFNAIYAEEIADKSKGEHSFGNFFERIYRQDYEKKIYRALWGNHQTLIQSFLGNPYVFQAYWDYKNQKISQFEWKKSFELDQAHTIQALRYKDSIGVLDQLFARFLTIRNQMVDGGIGYKSSMNRKQLDEGCRILLFLLPSFMHILIENAQSLDLEKPYYPAVQMS